VKISIKSKFALWLAAASLAAALAVPASASASIQLGVYTPGAPAQSSALSEYASMVGRQPDLVLWYRDFGQPLMYSDEIKSLGATGQTPIITWEPYDQSLEEIASGAYDSYLHESAKIAKSWGRTLMIRFAHEMNGTWYPWSGATSASAYISAWRHIVSLFRADGVTNVKWVWSPNIQEEGKYAISPYFPGDEWIDYVGLDGYNWGSNNGGSWQSAQEVFGASYAAVTQMSSKPVIITETSSSEAGGDKAAWIRNAFMTEIPQKFPRVSAVVWFDRSQEDDWRINSSQSSLEAYRAVVNCSIYGGTGPCEGATTTPPPPKKKKHGKIAVHSVHVTQTVSPQVSGIVSYGLSDSARVRIEIVPKAHPGRRSKVVRRSHRGHNRVPLQRLVHRRHLREGSYRVFVVARNAEGSSRRHKTRFRVL
jgi:mannan endo-1,4-beta-mannosidase